MMMIGSISSSSSRMITVEDGGFAALLEMNDEIERNLGVVGPHGVGWCVSVAQDIAIG